MTMPEPDHTHVDPDEATAANPHPDVWDAAEHTGWKPTRKMVAVTITGLIGYAATKLAIPWDPIIEQGVNLAVMVLVGYVVPNPKTPGGYTVKA